MLICQAVFSLYVYGFYGKLVLKRLQREALHMALLESGEMYLETIYVLSQESEFV